MTLNEAILKRLPLAIRIDQVNDRVIAELFIVEGGMVFADVYWRTSDAHPFHALEGTLSGNGPWQIGQAEIRVIEDGDPRAAEWNGWQDYLATDEGRLSTRELALAEALSYV